MRILGILGAVVTVTAGVGVVAYAQKAGQIDPPVVTRAAVASVADDIVGDWRGTIYTADRTQDFARVAVTLRFTPHGVMHYTRAPYVANGHARPVEDSGLAQYKVVGDSVILSLHGSGFPIEFVGITTSRDTLEFVVANEVALSGTLLEGGYVLTRQ